MIFDRYRFNEQVAMELGEKILLAIVALILTWLIARAAKWAFAKLVDAVDFFKRGTGSGQSLGESLGKIVSLLIWLFGLLIILNILELGGVAGPIDSLLENVVAFLPNLLWAGLIFFIGMMVARIVRDLVVTTLQTVDLDKWANRGGVDSVTGNSTISRTIGTIVYVLIAIPVAIAALEQLGIDSISAPASEMLRMIFAAIPNIIAAAVLLGIGYLISRFVVQIVKEILPGLGVDRAMAESGLVTEGTTVSGIIARVAQVAIILFVFMGLQFTGIGGMIPANALTILIAGVAVAGALAFGLGGRDWAARKLEQMDSDLGGTAAPTPKPKRGAAAKSTDPLPPGA